ncbi:MAG TPA: GDP-mannose 4,6-dehydratase [Phycisphaerae bacterium]|nr:GDP-mannose 4,6-dehydratase [Phycisphaerae bacterium]HRY66811.1 GDP-mannose 4,6-dehydratase [Phycisphaerae bacterium]HSA26869.1 GDP-mannose 4,6-dehydratase [Phycisphaerae bacterium]
MRHVVVTGAAGFIGSHLCEALLEGGWRVTGLDSFDRFYDPAVKWRNVSDCLGREGFKLVEGDIRDGVAVDAALGGGVDAVVHLAARAGVRPSIEEPLLYQDVNIQGTGVLLEGARKHAVGRFIFASSSSVYGNNRKVPFSESDNVDHPISPYAATKKAGELICHTYHHLHGMAVTCLRFFTVYGPRQRPDLAIHKFGRLIEQGKPIPVFGDGSMMRDYTFIADIVAGIVAALERAKGYHIYNLGNSSPVSLSDLIRVLEAALGKKALINRLPTQPGDVERTFADVSLARAELGFEPKTGLAAGLAEFVCWMRGS